MTRRRDYALARVGDDDQDAAQAARVEAKKR